MDLIQNHPKIKIDGFRFFQEQLESLRQTTLDTSAMAVYVALVSECNEAGILPTDFTQAKIANKIGIPRQTCSNGMNQLLERELVRESIIGERAHFEIVGYAENNVSRDETTGSAKPLSYFHIPFSLFNTPVISNLVSHKQSHGFIMMLELFNHFHRAFSRWGKDISYSYPLKMKTIITKLKKSSAHRARKTIEFLSPLFKFVPVDMVEKQPRDLINRVKKAFKQICIKKYDIFINTDFIIEKPMINQESVKALKDASFRIKLLDVPTNRSDKNGIRAAYHSIVGEVAKFVVGDFDRGLFLRDAMQTSLENLEAYLKTGVKLNGVGKYLNSQFQRFTISYIQEHDLYSRMKNYYITNNLDLPFILRKFEELQEEKFSSVTR